MVDKLAWKRILGSRMMTPEDEFKDRLFRACLSRYKRKNSVKVEVCPPGFADGSVDTWIERQTAGWSSSYGGMGMGNLRRKPK